MSAVTFVCRQNEVNVTAYLPRGVWYDFYTKKSLLGGPGKWSTLDAPLDTIPLMIRGGSVLPGQKPAVTTTDSRKNGFNLLIALDQKGTAQGELYWDDGDSLGTEHVISKRYVYVLCTVASFSSISRNRF